MTKEERLKKRHRSEKRFKLYGVASIFVALLFVLILVQNIFSKGSSAFMKTAINVEVFFDPVGEVQSVVVYGAGSDGPVGSGGPEITCFIDGHVYHSVANNGQASEYKNGRGV